MTSEYHYVVIEFKNLVKKFGPRTILNGLNFQIQKGEIVFILGTSGTGKSVLLKNIVGLMRPDGGEIVIDGQSLKDLSEDQFFQVRKKCGMVFQHPALFDSLTVFENIAYGLRRHFKYPEEEVRQRVLKSFEWVNLPDISSKYPTQISYGMQKRVSLARTLAIQPQILLFDEPTTGLDPVTTTLINELILKLSRELKTTSVVVSHDMECALKIADRIIVLDRGEILDSGTPSELLMSSVPLVRDFLAEVRAKS